MNDQIDYIGKWRPRDEARWYSTITLNCVEHQIPDGIGATEDGKNVLFLRTPKASLFAYPPCAG